MVFRRRLASSSGVAVSATLGNATHWAHTTTRQISHSVPSSSVRSFGLPMTTTQQQQSELLTSLGQCQQKRKFSFASSDAPEWISKLRQEAKESEKNVSYDIKIYDELAWRTKKYEFPVDTWDANFLSTEQKTKLCLGNLQREYTVIGEAFPFPDKGDSPVINEPSNTCRLLWDHSSPVEKIMIQLADGFPPLLWLTVKPNLTALRKVFREFIEADTQHMKKYLPYYESVQTRLEEQHGEKMGENLSNYAMKDAFTEDMRKKDPAELSLDWQKNFSVYMGTTESFAMVEDRFMKKNQFVFGWPLLMGEGNTHMEDKPVRAAAFRTVFSKSQILVHSRMDLQLDHRQVSLGDSDEMDIFLDIPVFATVNYPENQRLCGGKALIERFNKVMNTTYPTDMPVDVIAALYSKESTVKSPTDVMEELRFLKSASEKVPELDRVIRLSQDMIGANRILGQLAYTIVYLAILEHPDWLTTVYNTFKDHQADMIRVAVAKGTHILQDQEKVKAIIDAESEGRVKELLKKTLEMPHAAIGKSNEDEIAEMKVMADNNSSGATGAPSGDQS